MNIDLTGAFADVDEAYCDGGMMDWYFGGLWFWAGMLLFWLVTLVVAVLVYRDAEKRGRNGLLWLLLVAIPGVGVVALLLYLLWDDEPAGPADNARNAREYVRWRYARGEISRAEYARMMKELEEPPGTGRSVT